MVDGLRFDSVTQAAASVSKTRQISLVAAEARLRNNRIDSPKFFLFSRLVFMSVLRRVDAETPHAGSGSRYGDSARHEAGGSTATPRRSAYGAPKNAGQCTKRLDSPHGAPYHTRMHGGADSMCSRSY